VIHTFPVHPQDPAIDGSEMTWTADDEIKIMANVQAYFQVAHKACSLKIIFVSYRNLIPSVSQRFIDYIPLAIEHELNQNLANRIQNTLVDTLFKDEQTGRINMERLLDEDPVVARKRAGLKRKIAELERIKETLDEFWSGNSISGLSQEASESPIDVQWPASLRSPNSITSSSAGMGIPFPAAPSIRSDTSRFVD
jgi:hypothetical protein